jgi:hypothetical protein
MENTLQKIVFEQSILLLYNEANSHEPDAAEEILAGK